MENRKIMVYFANNCKAPFDRDKVSFRDGNGEFFTLSETYEGEATYGVLLEDGKAMINWDNVCYVHEMPAEEKNEI